MGYATRPLGIPDLPPEPQPLTEAEVDALVDSLLLPEIDDRGREWVALAELFKRRHQRMIQERDRFYADMRRYRRWPDIGAFAGTAVASLRHWEEESRSRYESQAPASRQFRRMVEQRTPEVRAAIIPVIDRTLAFLRDSVRLARNMAIETQALMYESVIDGDQLHTEQNVRLIQSGVIDVYSALGASHGSNKIRARRVDRELRRVSTHPGAPQLCLSPIGVTAGIWAANVGDDQIALLRREKSPEHDALIVLDLVNFLPVDRDNVDSLAAGAGWRLLNGRMEIVARGRESMSAWLGAMSDCGDLPAESIVGEVGAETIEW